MRRLICEEMDLLTNLLTVSILQHGHVSSHIVHLKSIRGLVNQISIKWRKKVSLLGFWERLKLIPHREAFLPTNVERLGGKLP